MQLLYASDAVILREKKKVTFNYRKQWINKINSWAKQTNKKQNFENKKIEIHF